VNPGAVMATLQIKSFGQRSSWISQQSDTKFETVGFGDASVGRFQVRIFRRGEMFLKIVDRDRPRAVLQVHQ